MPDARAILVELIREVRGMTVRVLEHADEGALLWAPAGLSNHIIWRSGHALWLVDVMCIAALAGRSELPRGWAETFGQHCRPVALTNQWPARGELLEHLQSQRERAIGLIEHVDAEALHRPARKLHSSRTLAGWIIHACHDEALHHGESYLILKMWRAGFSGGE